MRKVSIGCIPSVRQSIVRIRACGSETSSSSSDVALLHCDFALLHMVMMESCRASSSVASSSNTRLSISCSSLIVGSSFFAIFKIDVCLLFNEKMAYCGQRMYWSVGQMSRYGSMAMYLFEKGHILTFARQILKSFRSVVDAKHDDDC